MLGGRSRLLDAISDAVVVADANPTRWSRTGGSSRRSAPTAAIIEGGRPLRHVHHPSVPTPHTACIGCEIANTKAAAGAAGRPTRRDASGAGKRRQPGARRRRLRAPRGRSVARRHRSHAARSAAFAQRAPRLPLGMHSPPASPHEGNNPLASVPRASRASSAGSGASRFPEVERRGRRRGAVTCSSRKPAAAKRRTSCRCSGSRTRPSPRGWTQSPRRHAGAARFATPPAHRSCAPNSPTISQLWGREGANRGADESSA